MAYEAYDFGNGRYEIRATSGGSAISSDTQMGRGQSMRITTSASFPLSPTRWTALVKSQATRIYRH
jgi:hypothetical protein